MRLLARSCNASRNPCWHPGWRLLFLGCKFLKGFKRRHAMRSTSVPLSCFTPLARRAGHAEAYTILLRSIGIAALRFLTLSRLLGSCLLRVALPLFCGFRIPRQQAEHTVR